VVLLPPIYSHLILGIGGDTHFSVVEALILFIVFSYQDRLLIVGNASLQLLHLTLGPRLPLQGVLDRRAPVLHKLTAHPDYLPIELHFIIGEPVLFDFFILFIIILSDLVLTLVDIYGVLCGS